MRVDVGSLCAVVICTLSVVSASADGDGPFLFPNLSPEVQERLEPDQMRRLSQLSTRAYAGEWGQLEREAKALGEALVQKEQQDPVPYGVVSAYRAVAAAARGEESDAAWHWRVALNLLRGVDREELARAFDIAPALLPLEVPLPHPERSCPEADRRFQLRDKLGIHPGFQVGHRSRLPRKIYGFSAEAVVGVDDRLHSPRLMAPPADTGGDVAWSGLEAMRSMRFDPARSNGRPLECPFGVTLTFPPRR
jgi:hypothetical protein